MAEAKPKIFKSFYMYDNQENRELLKVIEDIRRRDGWTFSKLVYESLKEWRKKHEQNPQTMLFKFADKKKEKCYCGEEASHHAEATNGWEGFLCPMHYKRDRDARLLKKWTVL